MTHLDWSKDGEKLQSTSTDYELLFCKSIILKLIGALPTFILRCGQVYLGSTL